MERCRVDHAGRDAGCHRCRTNLPPPCSSLNAAAADLGFRCRRKGNARRPGKRAPLFASALNEEQIADLAAQCTVHELPKRRGADAPGRSGRAYVYHPGRRGEHFDRRARTEQSHEVAVSATGDIVGEMSLMTGAPRTATATVLAPTRGLEITKSGIEALLEKTPGSPSVSAPFSPSASANSTSMTDHASRKAHARDRHLARMKAFFANALRIAS